MAQICGETDDFSKWPSSSHGSDLRQRARFAQLLVRNRQGIIGTQMRISSAATTALDSLNYPPASRTL
jgi:hypothetical protein